jgi:hypothetical protein
MKSLYTYTKVGNADGIYLVTDKLSTLRYIGKVARVDPSRVWIAVPTGEPFDGRRHAFQTRAVAAHALARFVETGNREWIAPE